MRYKILNSVLNTVLNWLFKADRVIFNSIINLKRKVRTLIQEMENNLFMKHGGGVQ